MAFLVVVWSGNYIVGKIGLRELPPLALASFRLVLAGVVLLPVYFASMRAGRGSACVGPGSSLRDLRTFAYLGFFGVFINQGGFTLGLSYTSVSHSSLVIGFVPILILLLSWTQGLERLTTRKLLGVALAFAGAGVVGAEHGWSFRTSTMRGDLLTLCGGIGLALYTVLGKRVADAYSALRVNVFSNFAGALLALPIAFWQGAALTRQDAWHQIGWQGWGAVVYMGMLSSAVCYVLYFWMLRYMSPARLGSVSYLQPVGATLLAVMLLGEPLTAHVVIGGMLIVAGVYSIQSRSRGLRAEEELA
jgi:drug/metabolite transporter (DMT)-like permease